MPPRMRRIALCLFLLAASLAYSQERPKFKFMPGPKPGGGDVNITVDPGGTVEAQKDEYAIFTGNVRVEYQDIKMRSDKLTINHKTKNVAAEATVTTDKDRRPIT